MVTIVNQYVYRFIISNLQILRGFRQRLEGRRRRSIVQLRLGDGADPGERLLAYQVHVLLLLIFAGSSVGSDSKSILIKSFSNQTKYTRVGTVKVTGQDFGTGYTGKFDRFNRSQSVKIFLHYSMI